MVGIYRKDSKMSRTLDYLMGKGVDCVKIAGPNDIHEYGTTLFLALNVDDIENFRGRLRGVDGLITEDYMKIEADMLHGNWLSKLNPKLKVEPDKMYGVIKIKYV